MQDAGNPWGAGSCLDDLVEQAAQARSNSKLTTLPARSISATSVRERTALAKERKVAAHACAIDLHGQAAALQERIGHADRVAHSREHAAHARELLE